MVQVKAYHTQVVPKHTKIFETEAQAEVYKEILSTEVIWNTAVAIDILPVYCIRDEFGVFKLSGSFVKIEDV
jgi:hypothetical protein